MKRKLNEEDNGSQATKRQKLEQQLSLLDLPNELLSLTFGHLSDYEFIKVLPLVCKQFYNFFQNQDFWKAKVFATWYIFIDVSCLAHFSFTNFKLFYLLHCPMVIDPVFLLQEHRRNSFGSDNEEEEKQSEAHGTFKHFKQLQSAHKANYTRLKSLQYEISPKDYSVLLEEFYYKNVSEM